MREGVIVQRLCTHALPWCCYIARISPSLYNAELAPQPGLHAANSTLTCSVLPHICVRLVRACVRAPTSTAPSSAARQRARCVSSARGALVHGARRYPSDHRRDARTLSLRANHHPRSHERTTFLPTFSGRTHSMNSHPTACAFAPASSPIAHARIVRAVRSSSFLRRPLTDARRTRCSRPRYAKVKETVAIHARTSTGTSAPRPRPRRGPALITQAPPHARPHASSPFHQFRSPARVLR